MKRKYFSAAIAGLFVLLTMGCAFQDAVTTQPESTTFFNENTFSALSGETMYVGEVPYTVPPQTPTDGVEPGSQAANPPANASRPSDGVKVIGSTATGAEIKEINGVTYVGGILIVNKTYSLPEDYGPGGLTRDCQEAFDQLVAAARADGLSIYIQSGYRSYETQRGLYNRYCERDGKAAADTYSARPGHSEHQTGLAIDVNSISQSFANTAEGKWLAANAHKYGFIIRYGEDKQAITGYCYEPWHIRYVGVAVAQDVYNSGLCLEEYLGITSEYA